MKPGNDLWKVSKEKRLSVIKPEILEFWDDYPDSDGTKGSCKECAKFANN